MIVSSTDSSTTQITNSSGGGLSTGAIAGIVGGILGVFLLLCIVVIIFLIRRRKLVRELPKSTDGPDVAEPKEQETAAIGEMETVAAPQEVNGRPLVYTERDYGGRLRYPNDTVDVGGRLRPE